MFIIWGSTTRNKQVGEGAFYCPRCHNHRSYIHRRVKEYFTLYFIPLFPTNDLGEFIECSECGTNFEPSIRDRSPEEIEARQKPWHCPGCKALNHPSEFHCLSCKTRRPHGDVATQHAPSALPRIGRDDGAFHEAAPKANPRLAPAKPKDSAPADLGAILSSNKCRECGNVNSVVALHCKKCGSKLRAT